MFCILRDDDDDNERDGEHPHEEKVDESDGLPENVLKKNIELNVNLFSELPITIAFKNTEIFHINCVDQTSKKVYCNPIRKAIC